MNLFLVLAALFILVLAYGAWARRPKTPLAQLQALARSGARLLDVRTPGEYQSGHLPGALNVPLDQLPGRLKDVGRADRPVIVYCHSGARSMAAARVLRRAGYSAVHDLGAMGNWRA